MNLNAKPRTIFCHDNLPILRGLNSDSIDLIYLDPPFNKGRQFHAPIGTTAEGADFSDIWTPDSVKDEWHNQIIDKYPKLYKYLDSVGDIGSSSAKYYLIYMAVRLMEMGRILKETGSIYLHCDPTASHYLKLLMDTVFGVENFRTEISWKRTTAHSDTKQGRKLHGRIHDIILFYTKTNNWCWNPVFTKYDKDYVENTYRFVEPETNRHYQKDNLTAAKPGGDTLYEWRVKRLRGDDWESDLRNQWENPEPNWEYKGVPPYRGRSWAYSKEKMHEFAREGRIVYSQTGMPRYKRYLDEMPGVPLQDIWTDIHPPSRRECVGYPTQKPLALMDRILNASSNKGNIVPDPFCGCATTCIAAENLQRQWIGIDVSHKAYDLVKERLVKEVPSDLFRGEPIFRTNVPTRTDIPHKKAPTEEDKFHLFGKQNSKCYGCFTKFEVQHLEIDHFIPKSQGGSHERENLQLLCGHCNRVKGDRPMEYLKAKMKAIA